MFAKRVEKLRSAIHNISAVTFFGAAMAWAGPPQEHQVVLVTASVAIQSATSGTITLNYPITTPGWSQTWEVIGYKIYRKNKYDIAWGPPTEAPPTPHSFTETVPI